MKPLPAHLVCPHNGKGRNRRSFKVSPHPNHSRVSTAWNKKRKKHVDKILTHKKKVINKQEKNHLSCRDTTIAEGWDLGKELEPRAGFCSEF